MWWVWNAPATDSGTSRAFAGASADSAASCSTVPAATTWPGPLSFAAVTPCSASLASTSSRSPPSTAVIEVAVCWAAAAIALPRSRTSTIACSALSTPAPAAAASSPTLCPASAPAVPNAPSGASRISCAATRLAATSSGCAIAVSRIVSASASVP